MSTTVQFMSDLAREEGVNSTNLSEVNIFKASSLENYSIPMVFGLLACRWSVAE